MGEFDPLGEAGLAGALDVLQAAVEAADDAILITSADLRAPGPIIEYVNPAFTRMTGYAADEVVGRSPRILQGPRTDRAVLDRLRRDLAASGRFQGETINYRKDGSEFHLFWHISPVRDRAGAVTRWLAVQRDVSAQRSTEARLRESEEDRRCAAAFNPHIPWIADADGAVLQAGPRWYDMLGMSEAEALGRGWTRALHPDDLERTTAAWQRAIASGEPHDVTFRLRRADGSYRWFRARGGPRRGPGGEVLRWYGLLEDIHDYRMTEIALREIEERYRIAARATKDVIWDWDLATGSVQWNEALGARFGYPADAVDPAIEWWSERLHPDDHGRISRSLTHAIEGGATRWSGEYRFRRADGSWADILDRGHVIRDGDGRAVRMVGAMLDFTEERRAARALVESEERLRLAVEVTGLGIWDVNLLTGERKWSPEIYRMMGLPEDTPADPKYVLEILHPDDRGKFLADIEAAWAGQADFNFSNEFRYRRDGEERWVTTRGRLFHDEAGRRVRFVTAIRDITEEHRARELIRWSANHDELTQLPNRALFKDRLEQDLKANRRVGLFLLDLDHFKAINDTLGHDAGDAVLRAFADRVRTILPEAYTLARLGGDEFAVIAPGIRDARDLRTLADAMLMRLSEPFEHDGRLLDGRATIGASLYPDHGRTSTDLLKHADIALYQAKAAGRARMLIFEPKMRLATQMRASMLAVAREAVDGDRIMPFYQPKVSLHTGGLVGAEALLRWRSATGKIEPPAGIEPAFEDPYLAIAIGERMLERVLADLRDWLDAGVAFGRIAVNASPAEFRREGFAETLLSRLRASSVPADRIELEVTESVFLGQGAESARRELLLLHDEGIRIALDDFGTGFASLTHLKQFPVATLKVDRSFVRDLSTDAEDAAIVRAVLGLGASLGIETVAEGVETLAQAHHLWAQGCDTGQGYLFGRPLPTDAALVAFRSWAMKPHWKG